MLHYTDVMTMLSLYGIGVLALDSREYIVHANAASAQLLHGNRAEELCGRKLDDLLPDLPLQNSADFLSVHFGEYLKICPSPDAEGLAEGVRLLTFRDATAEVERARYQHALEQISDSVIMCDEQERICFLNDAALEMDGLALQDVLGDPIDQVYEDLDGRGLIIPRAIRTGQIFRDRRQYYTTRYHKNVDITANTFPVICDGQLLGGCSLMKDWSAIDSLSKKVVELQEKLLQKTGGRHKTEKNALPARYHFEDILHISHELDFVLQQCRQAAKGDSSVMFYGETGTGKELFAQSIHNASRRADRPFLAINCAAIPENLLEGLLFATEKGAYTGAERRPGLFEQADGGTLLLDELNSMNINLQAKLLRVLQDGRVRRIGSMEEIQVDVRIISNMNISPMEAIGQKLLRQDLFYRLGVVNFRIPPLRERREDIPLLTRHFIMRCNAKLERNIRDVSPGTLQIFQQYGWPGNVRELEHVIEHAANVLPEGVSAVTPDCLPSYMLTDDTSEAVPSIRTAAPVQSSEPGDTPLGRSMKELERTAICRVLQEHNGNITASARALGMSRQSLQYRLRKYNITGSDL